MKICLITLTAIAALGLGCSSAPSIDKNAPAWVSQPARTVDNGYIVYVGTGEEVDPNDAQKAAEGMAIQDLANECSFIPKGTRVEDHYSQKLEHTYRAYAKVAVEFATCDQAQKTVDPVDIKKLASEPFTEELKNYQDMNENRSEVVDLQPAAQTSGAPAPITGDVHFFVVRQWVACQKEVVILAPPGEYAAGSSESVSFVKRVRPAVVPLAGYAAANPRLIAAPVTWSSVEPKARVAFPHSFKTTHAQAFKAPYRPEGFAGHPLREHRQGRRGRRRRKRF